ncbi:hypothetical protein CP10743SC13_1134, partial [Chlamydia psittaci 10_743_SC13]
PPFSRKARISHRENTTFPLKIPTFSSRKFHFSPENNAFLPQIHHVSPENHTFSHRKYHLSKENHSFSPRKYHL